jgi:hypothetical protein
MAPGLNPFAAAPALMKPWLDFSGEILQGDLDENFGSVS